VLKVGIEKMKCQQNCSHERTNAGALSSFFSFQTDYFQLRRLAAGPDISSPCEKCGDAHDPTWCPNYGSKIRGAHADAQRCSDRDRSAASKFSTIHARVHKMPKDGHCLFTALNYDGKKAGKHYTHTMTVLSSTQNQPTLDYSGARSTRAGIADFMKDNPNMQSYGSDMSYADRSIAECGMPIDEYANSMRNSGKYGGTFEADAHSKMNKCRVIIYERFGKGTFQAISSCEVPGYTSTRHLLYEDGIHYDVLEPIADFSLQKGETGSSSSATATPPVPLCPPPPPPHPPPWRPLQATARRANA